MTAAADPLAILKTGRPFAGALAICTQLVLADAAGFDVRMLARQRAALGDEQFLHILQTPWTPAAPPPS